VLAVSLAIAVTIFSEGATARGYPRAMSMTRSELLE